MTRFDSIKEQLEQLLPKKRFEHSVGVAYTAASLALLYGASYENALLGGLLHDCAKYMKDDELLLFAQQNGIEISIYEEQLPSLLHAKIGSYFAKNKYGIEEEDILSAIRFHTTGRPDMTLLEQILFVSDYIEPNRNGLLLLEEGRTLAFQNLNLATYTVCQGSVKHVRKKGGIMDPLTIETMEYYKQLCQTEQ